MSFCLASIVTFIALNSGPAEHFATFSEELTKKGHTVHIYANGAALKKFEERKSQNIIPFSLENVDPEIVAKDIANKCCQASCIITDVGHTFDITLQKILGEQLPNAYRLAYYDNPEAFVPGGYSDIAKEVMSLSEKVVFANANLVKAETLTVPFNKRIGLGYYPVQQAEKIQKRRAHEHNLIREEFFAINHLRDNGQKIVVYFGGNNSEYFDKALPAFLEFLTENIKELSNYIFLYQQHPGAKEKNLDLMKIAAWKDQCYACEKGAKFVFSKLNIDDVQVMADYVLYYQTSMAAQFALSHIPTIQVGHATYDDILTENKLCASVTNASDFLMALTQTTKKENGYKDKIMKGLGIKAHFERNLEALVKPKSLTKYYVFGFVVLLAFALFMISSSLKSV